MYINRKANTSIYSIGCLFILALIILFFSHCRSNDKAIIYDDPKLEDFQIFCNNDSLAYIYTNYKDNTYIPVKILFDGDTLKGRMRIRGDSSRKYAKKSLKVKFMQNGISRTLNFNAEYSDKSFVRQFVSSHIMQASGQYCFNTSYANIFINGDFFGLYLKVENMDIGFLKRNLLSENGNLYKATKDGACLSVFETVEEKWEQKNGAQQNFDDLKNLIAEVNAVSNKDYFAFVQEKFNYPDFVNMLALNIYVANGSTYYHNYYLYHHPGGKWELIPWDMDKSLSYYDWMPYQYHRTSSEWESDNPLVEKAFLNGRIFKDIKLRLKELAETSCTENELVKLIDKLEVLIENAVEKDTTDQIIDPKEWKGFLEKERSFIKNRYAILQQQFENWPTTFAVKRIDQKVCDEILFQWNKSKSSTGKEISYMLSISSDFLFQDSTKLITKTTKDTVFVFAEQIAEGKYYWKVTATDGEFLVDGFNSKNVFEKVSCTALPKEITSRLRLTKDGAPYLIQKTLTVQKEGGLTIEKGVEIRLDTGVNILVHGAFLAAGTDENPIIFKPMQKAKEWGYFYFFNTSAKFESSRIFEGKINSKYTDLKIINSSINIKKKRLVFGVNRNPIIWTHHGAFYLENSIIDGKGTGEGINTNFSKSIVKNSTFIDLPDAIEFICVNEGLIENCIVKNSPDDAIDMNACHNIIVANNTIVYNSDKGISVGKEQYGHSSNILIENNKLIGNKIGVAVKDSSFALIKNNLFYNNNTAISIYRKDPLSVGGNAEISLNAFYKNSSSFNVDDFSKAEVLINYSDGILPLGKTKTIENLKDSLESFIDYQK